MSEINMNEAPIGTHHMRHAFGIHNLGAIHVRPTQAVIRHCRSVTTPAWRVMMDCCGGANAEYGIWSCRRPVPNFDKVIFKSYTAQIKFRAEQHTYVLLDRVTGTPRGESKIDRMREVARVNWRGFRSSTSQCLPALRVWTLVVLPGAQSFFKFLMLFQPRLLVIVIYCDAISSFLVPISVMIFVFFPNPVTKFPGA